MIPFKKIFILIVRTFSHPMLNYVKRKQQQNKLRFFSGFFMGLGRRSHQLEHWVNRNVLKSTKKIFATRLSDKIALEKGVQSFYEVVFYAIILGLPLYEMYKGSKATHMKESHQKERIKSLQKQILELNQRVAAVLELAKQVVQEGKQAEKNRKKLEADTRAKMQELGEGGKDGEEAIQSLEQKIEQMIENVVEVVGQQFQEHFDQTDGPIFGSEDNKGDTQTQAQTQPQPQPQVQVQVQADSDTTTGDS